MLHPDDHAAYLAKHDFILPPGDDFTDAERDLLRKYGRWMDAIASGVLQPTTVSQEQFLLAARGERDPQSDFEKSWAKVMQWRALGEGVVRTFVALRDARKHAAKVETEYLAARAEVLAVVREQLDAVDAAFAEQIQNATNGATTAEQAVRDLVLKLGRSMTRLAGIHATYNAGRVTWDNEKMANFAERFPEVLEYRKVGKPSVALRFGDVSGTGTVSEAGEVKAG